MTHQTPAGSVPARTLMASGLGRVGVCAAVLLGLSGAASAQTSVAPGPNIRITQVYAVGGTATSTYRNDFIELYNPTQRTINLGTYAVHFASATAATTWSKRALPAVNLAPGQYFLLSMAGGASTVPAVLPTPDDNWTFGMGTTGTKVAVTNDASVTLAGTSPVSDAIVDVVGFASNATAYEGTASSAQSTATASVRRVNSCVDTNNNLSDFALATPPTPRNSGTISPCAPTALDLLVTGSSSAAILTQIGQTATYTFSVYNLGTDLTGATGGVLTVQLPPSLTYSGSSLPGSYNASTRTLTIALSPIEGAPYKQTVTVETTAVANSNTPVTATVSSSTAETNTANNTVSVALLVSEQADLGLTLTPPGACDSPLPIGQTATWGLSLNNAGTANSTSVVTTINLPTGTTWLPSSSVSLGTLTHSGSVATWTIPSLANGATVSATINLTVAEAGVMRFSASTTSASLDNNPANNSVLATNAALPAAGAAPLIITSVAGHPLSAVPVPGGGAYTGTTAIQRPFGSPDGSKFIFRGTVTGGTNVDDVLLIGTTGATPTINFVTRKGTEFVGNGVVGPIDPFISINNAGQFVFSTNTDEATNIDEIVVKGSGLNPSTLTVVTREGDPVSVLSPNSVQFGSSNNAAGITASGDVGIVTTLAGDSSVITTGAGANNQAFMSGAGAAVLLRKGVDAPTNQLAGPGNATYGTFEAGNTVSRLTTRSDDGAHFILTGVLNTGSTSNDEVIVVDGAVALQESAAIPGATNATPVGQFSFSNMMPDGHWFAYGRYAPISSTTGFGWLVRDGVVIAEHGQPITPGSTELWAGNAVNPAFPATFNMALGRGSEYIIGGVTNFADTYRNSVLVYNGTTVIAREGDRVDLDGDGQPNDDAYIASFVDDAAFISADHKLWVVVNLRTAAATCAAAAGATPLAPATIGQALITINLPPLPSACLADINSDGTVDGGDFVLFINSFAIGDVGIDPVADVNLDGTIDGGDFVAFINAFALGC